MKTLYFAHPTPRREEAMGLQRKLEALGFKIVNPFIVNPVNKPGMINNDDHMERCEKVVTGDLRFIRAVDGVVVWLPEPSIGTSMETISAAFWMDKPSFTLFPGNMPHPWLKYLTVMVRTEEALLNAVKAWAEGVPMPARMKKFKSLRMELLK